MATVIITGGTGMIGTALGKLLLGRGYTVIILTRNPKGENEVAWNPARLIIDRAAIQRADFIVNLAGANVGEKRWTRERKKEITDSRVRSAETLIKALKEIPNKVKAVVQASGVDWYPADPTIPNKTPFTEDAPHGNHFLGKVCEEWEGSMEPVTSLGKRLVILRTAMVLSKTGGALDQLERPVRFGMAAYLGSGKQMTSWIHIEDLARMYLYAIENENMRGVYNAAAPNPISNKTLMLELAQLITGRFYIPMPVPGLILRLIYGELGAALLKSTTVSSEKILDAGFQFSFPTIEAALFDIEKK